MPNDIRRVGGELRNISFSANQITKLELLRLKMDLKPWTERCFTEIALLEMRFHKQYS